MNPLDQLADIQIPEQVGMWPLAIGYWIVLLMTLSTLMLTFYLVHQRNKRRLQRNASLMALANLDANDEHLATQVHHILKTAATAYLPAYDVLQLHGSAWQKILDQLYTRADKTEVCESLAKLAKWQYDQRIALPDNGQLIEHASKWIKYALPPKKEHVDV
jgi:hypothetical protein